MVVIYMVKQVDFTFGLGYDAMMFASALTLSLLFGLCLAFRPLLWAIFSLLVVITLWKGYYLVKSKKVPKNKLYGVK